MITLKVRYQQLFLLVSIIWNSVSSLVSYQVVTLIVEVTGTFAFDTVPQNRIISSVPKTRHSCCITFSLFLLIWHHFFVHCIMVIGIQKVWMSVKIMMSLSRCVNRIVILQLSTFLCNSKSWAVQRQVIIQQWVFCLCQGWNFWLLKAQEKLDI